jgi:NAD(P)-dependent dehydrogenase (short-subunit alcohol dehydrogenase family)
VAISTSPHPRGPANTVSGGPFSTPADPAVGEQFGDPIQVPGIQQLGIGVDEVGDLARCPSSAAMLADQTRLRQVRREPGGSADGERRRLGNLSGVGVTVRRRPASGSATQALAEPRSSWRSATRAGCGGAEVGGSRGGQLDLADQPRCGRSGPLTDVDILINNAGALTEHRTETVDGFEGTIGTNLLGRSRLTNRQRCGSQIINVGSEAHKSATLRIDDPHLRTHKWTTMGATRDRSWRSCCGVWTSTAGCVPRARRWSPS